MAAAANFGLITQEEAALRTIQFSAGGNGILVEDESLTPLVGLPAPLPPSLPSVRLANENDLISLVAGGILGTLADPNNPLSVIGVAVPLADEFTLLSDELAEVQNRTDAFNTIIANTLVGLEVEDRVALADINQAYKDLVADSPLSIDGVAVTTSIVPPTGIFSEDGVHPNSRGYAITANVFIDAINEKFGANLIKANIGQYPGNGLPQ
jgi:lysophospholipase L1-like esterase